MVFSANDGPPGSPPSNFEPAESFKFRAGGLFSEISVPNIDDDVLVDSILYNNILELLSLLREELSLDGAVRLCRTLDVEQSVLEGLLQSIETKDVLLLKQLAICFGLSVPSTRGSKLIIPSP